MKIETPPKFKHLMLEKYIDSLKKDGVPFFLEEANKRYFYWSEIKYRPNLPFESPEAAWEILKTHRISKGKFITFGAHHTNYNLTSSIQKDLHNFDLNLIAGFYKNPITDQDKIDYFKNSLLEEAIASSQVEGAATTTDVAKELIKSGRKPKNESEQMIMNNFRAIREIENRLEEGLSVELILDIHQIMCANTTADKYVGSFRNHPIHVVNHIDGEVAFTAPNHEEVVELISSLIFFINNEEEFVHPIIKASILHFMFAYIHPFGDGNGRTARALFYWFLIKKGYTLLKHISISKAILDSRNSYDKAFLRTEHDDNDLTYFIMYSMKTLRVAFQNLLKYRDRKKEEKLKTIEVMHKLTQKGFSSRQADVLSYLFIKSKSEIQVASYAQKHGIVRQTATKDLTELEKKGILLKFKNGKYNVYKLLDRNKFQNDFLND
jgi:Fic family protein